MNKLNFKRDFFSGMNIIRKFFVPLAFISYLKNLCVIFFWLSAYIAMFSLWFHLLSYLCGQVVSDPGFAVLVFVPLNICVIYLFLRLYQSFFLGVSR